MHTCTYNIVLFLSSIMQDSSDFAGRIERMMRMSLGVDLSAKTDYFEVESSSEDSEEGGEAGEGEMPEGVEQEDVFDDVSEDPTVKPPVTEPPQADKVCVCVCVCVFVYVCVPAICMHTE